MADSTSGNQQPQRRSVQDYLMANKFDAVQLFIRLYIIFATALFIIPLFGVEYSMTCFKRVLLGNACISALKLHYRLPPVTLSKEFIRVLVMEDSFHYLIYSVLFLFSRPQTMALVPIMVFALLHSAVFLQKLVTNTRCPAIVANSIQQLTLKITDANMQRSILTFIASTEIMLFFVSIALLFVGRGSLLVPFFYYRFLQLRYMSHRNPYSRLVFASLRMKIQQMANQPNCPAIAKKGLMLVVTMASKLSPASMAAPAAS